MKNQYLSDFYEMCVNRYAIDASDMKTSEWLCQNTTLKGRPFSFDKYPFQRELVDDDHPHSTTKKPSQVGVSEVYQRVALAFLARHRNTKGIYAYPGDDMRKKNVQTRVMPLVNTNDVFNKDQGGGEKPVRSIQLLQINQSFLYMTGSKEEDATSTDADFVFLDEYDLHDMDIAGLFNSRLLNSEWKIKKYFSTPTFTDYGVDLLYQNSDQMEYQIKCDSCNHWQFPIFAPQFIHIDNLPSDINDLLEIDQSMIEHFHMNIEDGYVCCERCRAPLDLGRENNRAWVAKFPSRRYHRGRRVNPFSVSTRPVRDVVLELLDYKKKDKIRRFKNTVLGEAEDSSNARISEALIRACIGAREQPALDRNTPTWVGVDMGHTCHLVVGQGYTVDRIHVVLVEAVALKNLRARLVELRKVYNLMGGVVDRHPESQVAADVRDDSNSVILPCEYRGEKEINEVKDPLGTVIHLQADRTTLLDEVARAVRMQNILFEGYGQHEIDIITHLRNMIRIEEPETKAVWQKLDPLDHIFHATGFMLTAVKYRDLREGLTSIPQSVIGIAGATMAGYNDPKLVGVHSATKKANQSWEIPLLMR